MFVMKKLRLLVILTLLISCTKKTDDPIIVTSFDQIEGIWKWESTCGGIVNSCAYSSDSHYAEIKFTLENKIIETHNDAIYLTANYTIKTSDNSSGILTLVNIESNSIISNSIQYSFSIKNDELFIARGELLDTYKKIR
jgi:hypothetical protein